MSRTVIIGGGQAGGRCAVTLRTKGYEGGILLLGDEPLPPYRRPPLSKTVLLGENTVEDGCFRSLADYADNDIDVRLERRAVEVDTDRRRVRCEGGDDEGFDHLVLATGASPRTLPVPGHDLDHVHLLRTAVHARAIKARLLPEQRIVIIGGGFIGLEVASSARQLGCRVTVLEAQDRILSRSVPEAAAAAVAAVHGDEGVEIRTGVRIEAFDGKDRVEGVILAGGEVVAADTVVVGIGITPDTSLAEAAGLEVSDGIRVDEYGRTADENILAAGDCASCYLPRYSRHMRLESFQNADQQGMSTAATIAGQPAAYDPVPFVWSDQYDRVLQTAGFPGEGDRHVQRGSIEDRNLVLFSFAGERFVGVTGWGQGRLIARDIRLSQSLMQKGVDPDPDQLTDPDVAIKDLVPGS
ncbi:MAG: FAD-dependent oxidoreductase [Gammaproteobacteria bacterium]|nr:FAD-dependent oxidoreductase [Gammaproteobacteria bacterium]